MKVKQKSLKVNAILNMIKQLCTILFPLITFPYASRVLGTGNYGKINFSASIVSYISLLAGLGIQNYSIREGAKVRDNRSELNRMANEIFSINIISTCAAYLVLFCLLFSKSLNGYVVLLLIQSLSIIFTTIGTDWINSIYEDYVYITIRYIMCQAISIVIMLLFVKTSNDYIVYAFASISGTVIANVVNFFYIRNRYGLHIRFILNFNAKKHMKPILIMFGSAIASLIYINSDVTLLGILKDENEVGLYSVSAKIYTLIKQLLNALLVVSIPRVSSELATLKITEVKKRIEEILYDLILLAVPACVGLFFLSYNIIRFLSGTEYVNAGDSLRILSIALLLATTACFFVHVILIPFGKESYILTATIISALINVILNIVLIPHWGQNAAAATTVLSEFVMLGMSSFHAKKIIHLSIGKISFVSIFEGVGTGIICIFFNLILENDIAIIFCSVMLAVIYCIAILLIFYREKILYIIRSFSHIISH